MEPPRVIISSHAVFVGDKDVFGPGHAISNVLSNARVPHVYIRHSLYGGNPTLIETVTGKKRSVIHKTIRWPGPLRYVSEMGSVISFLFGTPRVRIFIGIDPLNAMAGLLGKLSGRVDTVIFYTADYAFNRFENPVLNTVYHALDRVAIRFSDKVWNVSSRITEIRKGQGVPPHKNVFVPNSPSLTFMNTFASRVKRKKSMVLIANFTPAIDYVLIVRAVAKLKEKHPSIHVSFIGTGAREDEIKELVAQNKLGKNVTFHGFQNHDDAMRILSKHEIGLALYAKQWAWTEFGDSMKAREYLALGLPVIITNDVSTADDIRDYEAGYSINLSEQEFTEALDTLLSDRRLYERMRNNAIKLAGKFDFETILTEQLKQYKL